MMASYDEEDMSDLTSLDERTEDEREQEQEQEPGARVDKGKGPALPSTPPRSTPSQTLSNPSHPHLSQPEERGPSTTSGVSAPSQPVPTTHPAAATTVLTAESSSMTLGRSRSFQLDPALLSPSQRPPSTTTAYRPSSVLSSRGNSPVSGAPYRYSEYRPSISVSPGPIPLPRSHLSPSPSTSTSTTNTTSRAHSPLRFDRRPPIDWTRNSSSNLTAPLLKRNFSSLSTASSSGEGHLELGLESKRFRGGDEYELSLLNPHLTEEMLNKALAERGRGRGRDEYEEEEEGDQEEEEEKGVDEKSKKKRVRQPKPKQDPKKRKGGRLGRLEAMLVKMPLEILGEILSNLPSSNLLRLTRTARIFRTLLLDRSLSKGTWVSAFGKDGVWDFAETEPVASTSALEGDGVDVGDGGGDGMGEEMVRGEAGKKKKGVGSNGFEDTGFGEVMWASLIWDKECQICGRLKVHKIDYSLRTRVCDTCLKNELSTKDGHSLKHPNLHPRVWECTPFSSSPIRALSIRGDKYFLESSLLATSAKLDALQNRDLNTSAAIADPPSPLSSDTTTTPLTPSQEVDKYVQDWKERSTKMEMDTKMMTKWQKWHDGQNVDGKRNAKKEREKAIRNHCVAHGADLIDINALFTQGSPVWGLIDQPYALTDRVWRKIQHPILAALSDARTSRENLVRERTERERQETARRLAQRHFGDARMNPQGLPVDDLILQYVRSQRQSGFSDASISSNTSAYLDELTSSGTNASTMLASLYALSGTSSGSGSGSGAGPSGSTRQ